MKRWSEADNSLKEKLSLFRPICPLAAILYNPCSLGGTPIEAIGL
jgi:hypothetical protein